MRCRVMGPRETGPPPRWQVIHREPRLGPPQGIRRRAIRSFESVFVEAVDVECGVRTGVPSLSDTRPLLCFAGLRNPAGVSRAFLMEIWLRHSVHQRDLSSPDTGQSIRDAPRSRGDTCDGSSVLRRHLPRQAMGRRARAPPALSRPPSPRSRSTGPRCRRRFGPCMCQRGPGVSQHHRPEQDCIRVGIKKCAIRALFPGRREHRSYHAKATATARKSPRLVPEPMLAACGFVMPAQCSPSGRS